MESPNYHNVPRGHHDKKRVKFIKKIYGDISNVYLKENPWKYLYYGKTSLLKMRLDLEV